MKFGLLSALLCAGLGTVLPASAQTWSISVEGGSARLETDGARSDEFDRGIGIGATWWMTPKYALEASVMRTNDARPVDSDGNVVATEPLRSIRIGARAQWPIGAHGFVLGRAGLAHSRVSRETPVIITESFDPVSNIGVSRIEFRDIRSTDTAPYLSLGLGWQWNEHWSSSVQAAREFTDLGLRCVQGVGTCDAGRNSHFDTLTVALEYRFGR